MGKCVIKRDNRPEIKARLHAGIDAAVAKAAHDCEALAKTAAPVDKGFLRASIRAERLGPGKWRVVVGAKYGIFVELGTRFKAARPFLGPAFLRVVPSLKAAIRALGKR